jgi:hypothetical protein
MLVAATLLTLVLLILLTLARSTLQSLSLPPTLRKSSAARHQNFTGFAASEQSLRLSGAIAGCDAEERCGGRFMARHHRELLRY